MLLFLREQPPGMRGRTLYIGSPQPKISTLANKADIADKVHAWVKIPMMDLIPLWTFEPECFKYDATDINHPVRLGVSHLQGLDIPTPQS